MCAMDGKPLVLVFTPGHFMRFLLIGYLSDLLKHFNLNLAA